VITSIEVHLPSPSPRRYRVHIAAGMLDDIPRRVAAMFPARRIWLITDSTVLRLYGRKLHRSLVRAGMDTVVLEIPPGEASKHERVVRAIQTHMLEQGIDRDSVIVALGGGVVGDTAGFVAATLLRGIAYVQVPTTLLAQVDSSVGGKVGINHRLGKNLIGAFHHPAAVYIDTALLSTLPAAEFRNGMAEVIKIAAATDREFFRELERRNRRLTRTAPGMLTHLVARAVRLKAGIVGRDEREQALRKVLNLGHTIGHAVEAASGFGIQHGEAVSIGLVAESRIACAMGMLPPADLARLSRLLRSAGLPVQIPRKLDRKRFASALAVDKKSALGMARFVLLRRLGQCVVGVSVPTPFLAAFTGDEA
jgi:3-dehydroquinate synthase